VFLRVCDQTGLANLPLFKTADAYAVSRATRS
jgi:hypothetical protein